MNGRASPTTTAWLIKRVRAQTVLERCRRDVLAGGGDDEFLLAAGDPEEAVVVEGADVAGQEPSVVVEQLAAVAASLRQ